MYVACLYISLERMAFSQGLGGAVVPFCMLCAKSANVQFRFIHWIDHLTSCYRHFYNATKTLNSSIQQSCRTSLVLQRVYILGCSSTKIFGRSSQYPTFHILYFSSGFLRKTRGANGLNLPSILEKNTCTRQILGNICRSRVFHD